MPSTILSDNGVTSNTSGIKVAGSNDGILELQTTTAGGTATTAITINTSQAATFAQTANLPNTFGFKNRIINGAMVIDQRNAGASVTPSSDGTYTVDRWAAGMTQASKYSVQQNAGAVTPPVGFKNYIGVTSTSSYSVLSGDYFILYQPIEGFNISDLAWGTANAKAVTLSFQVYSSLTGTFGGSLWTAVSGAYLPFSYTVASANTWTTVSVSVPGPTIGSWNTNNSIGVYVNFGLGAGSTYAGGTSGTWSSSLYSQPASTVSVVGTNGATFYITGVQLEVGSTATSFDYRDYGRELAMCQRYFVLCASATDDPLGLASLYTTTNVSFSFFMPVTMRTSPTILSTIATYRVNWQSSGANSTTAPTINVDSPQVVTFDQGGYTGLTAGNAGVIRSFDPGRLALSSEL